LPNAHSLPAGRRADLDWLRVIAIGLLIVTHTLVIYRTFEWRVHSTHAGEWGNLAGGVLGPWRMCLVFLIGGAATRFLIEKRRFKALARDRALRLIVPFIFAVLVLVPLEKLAAVDAADGLAAYAEALRAHWTFPSHVILGVPLPDFGNAWFLPYLFVYGLGAALLVRGAPRAFAAIERRLGAMPVFALAAGLGLAFLLADAVVSQLAPMSGALLNDPAGHVRFLTPFLLGLFLVRSDLFWLRLQAARWRLAFIAAPLLVASLVFLHLLTQAGGDASERLVLDYAIAESLFGAAAIFAILAFASRWLRNANASPRARNAFGYLSEAIMPIYLMHQIVIMLAGALLIPLALPAIIEFPAIVAAALLTPLAVYHVAIRPFGPARFLFGLKPLAATQPAAQPALQPAAG
jgi:glucan biosynthesis protein C